MIKIAYIGGGSMNWAWEMMSDLALEPLLSGEVKLYDTDRDAAKANEIIGNRLKDEPGASKWDYAAVGSLRDALTGADFVVISILPGTFDEMESDVHLPEKYGIYQSVGDTTGPGGIVRAMRTIPMFAEMAEAIKAYAPGAWVINYTNPMSVCTSALYKVFPDIKAFVCCHEVFHSQHLFMKMIKEEYGINVGDKSEIKLNVIGVNHFTWITRASYKTYDLMPLYEKYAKKYAETGMVLNESDTDENNFFRNINKVAFDLYNRYGVVPCAGDRHIAEFMPPWYLKNPETVKKWGFDLTPVCHRKKGRAEKLDKRARIVSGEEKFEIKHSGEEGAEQMKALLGYGGLFTNVNVPNIGQAEGLPRGAVIETNAVFEKNWLAPVFAGKLPDAVNQIVYKHAANQLMLTDAALKKDAGLAFHAFLNDNLTNIDIKDAEELFYKMLDNTKKYLPGWKF